MTENSVLLSLKQRHMWGGVLHHSNSHYDAANSALELMRINIQEHFSKEVLGILAKFREKYFMPAMKNIKENLGEHSVTEEQIHRVCVALLSGARDFLETKWAEEEESIQGDVTPTTDAPAKVSGSKGILRKRKEAEVEPLVMSKGQNSFPDVPLLSVLRSQKMPKIEMNFVLEINASKVFDRDRILTKHPELTYYQPDYQDREWLVGQKIIPNRNAPATLLLHEELLKLAEIRLEYKNSVKVSELQTFRLPEFIIKKFEKFTLGTLEASSNQHLKTRSSLSSSHATLSALLAKQTDLINET
ncbi:deoxynucleotidyltransferase terminal-interacting protein 1 [Lutzomyia longipalpis]|uniref:deoxynucleotidyltransferase terminal-interacting protein 1 n=1 Tax=Lutzomyia longipalpis TaxID=7200 RepID=UPI00248450E9|nr:deoxynucleotidyltransferase terminal-interacting protein 1 [Lutzomyia longipalpis]